MRFERISAKAMLFWELLLGLLMAVLLLLCILILNPGTWLWYTVLWVWGAVWVLGAFLYIPLYYFSVEYGVSDDAIVYRKGVIFPNTQVLYRERIAFVTVYRNPLTPIFHISTLSVSAAGGNIRILFIHSKRAEELAGLLTGKPLVFSEGGQAG